MLLHLTDPSGREFAILDEPLALEDLTEGRRLGNILGDVHPFLIKMQGADHLIIAGLADTRHHHVNVEFTHASEFCRVCHRVWATFPQPFTPGTAVTATWHDEAGVELRRVTSPPLFPDALKPVLGPWWKGYAPGQ
jgi:hypothetical protein